MNSINILKYQKNCLDIFYNNIDNTKLDIII